MTTPREASSKAAAGAPASGLPRIGSSAEMPSAGPEVLHKIFVLGALTTGQARVLLETPLRERRMRQVLAMLGDPETGGAGYVSSVRRKFRYAFEPARWHTVHHLTQAGLIYVGAMRNLHPTRAASSYSRVLKHTSVDHTLFRNEFYARLLSDLEAAGRQDEYLKRVRLETMCGEAGMDAMPVNPKRDPGKGTWLNPDGMLGFFHERDHAFSEEFFVEADTGTEDAWQIKSHVEKYADHLAERVAAGRPAPKVLWVCPTETRTRWLYRVFYGLVNDRQSRFNEVATSFHESGRSLLGLFLLTNTEWLRSRGGVGPAYWPIDQGQRTGPFAIKTPGG